MSAAVAPMLAGAAVLVLGTLALMMITNYRHNLRPRTPWPTATEQPPSD